LDPGKCLYYDSQYTGEQHGGVNQAKVRRLCNQLLFTIALNLMR